MYKNIEVNLVFVKEHKIENSSDSFNIPERLRSRHGVVTAVHDSGYLRQDDLFDNQRHEPVVWV